MKYLRAPEESEYSKHLLGACVGGVRVMGSVSTVLSETLRDLKKRFLTAPST
jgi:hypothetical protein